MTTTYSTVPLSGATDFRGIKITATSLAAGVTLHTAQASATLVDIPRMGFCNMDTVSRPLKLGWGGTTSPDDVIPFVLLPGQTIWIPKMPIRNALVIKAASETLTWIDGVSYVGAANVIACIGGSWVQRQLT